MLKVRSEAIVRLKKNIVSVKITAINCFISDIKNSLSFILHGISLLNLFIFFEIF